MDDYEYTSIINNTWFTGEHQFQIGQSRQDPHVLTVSYLRRGEEEWMNEWTNECLTTPQHKIKYNKPKFQLLYNLKIIRNELKLDAVEM